MQRLTPIVFLICSLFFTGCATTKAVCDTQCQAQERRQAYVLANPKLLDKHKKAILIGQIRLGMSREDVLASLGPPKATVDTNAFWAEREQWIYEHHDKAKFYYFKFGRLHSWHTTPKVNTPSLTPVP